LAKPVSYRIADRLDGRFDVIVVLHPHKVFRRVGLLTRAEAEEWLDGRLRRPARRAPGEHRGPGAGHLGPAVLSVPRPRDMRRDSLRLECLSPTRVSVECPRTRSPARRD
jgi:hypothetical protein